MGSDLPWICPPARKAMIRRGISEEAVEAAISWGTDKAQDRGRVAYVVDGHAIRRASFDGVDIEAHRGVEVTLGDDGDVLAVYRHTGNGGRGAAP